MELTRYSIARYTLSRQPSLVLRQFVHTVYRTIAVHACIGPLVFPSLIVLPLCPIGMHLMMYPQHHAAAAGGSVETDQHRSRLAKFKALASKARTSDVEDGKITTRPAAARFVLLL